jgi:flagellar biosynthesis regulator FlaF
MFPLAAIFDIGNKLIDKLIPDPTAKAEAQQKLLELQAQGRLAELQADSIEAQELTKRLQSDMASDSWLSKNIRPMTLIAILVGYFVFAMMSAFNMNANENYVRLLGDWGMLIMSFYFGGRTLEKIMDMRSKSNGKQAN